jgi:CotH kinase protein/Fibronectin type III domain
MPLRAELTIPESSIPSSWRMPCTEGWEVAKAVGYLPATISLQYWSGGQLNASFGPWSISMRLKGMGGSFRCLGQKPGLKLKFPSGRRPYGLKKLTLNNMVGDYSMVHEVLSYDVFRSLSVAAPRTMYAQVTLNGVYQGIYLEVETMDDVALRRWFASTQHLYEGTYGAWWGPVSDPFSAHYEVDEGNTTNRNDLQRLLDTAQDLAPGWYSRMSPLADLDQMTRFWAAEWFVGQWDGYLNRINNYYLHSDANGRFSMMPWGTDWSMTTEEASVGSLIPIYPSPVPTGRYLMDGCLADPICHAMYMDALALLASRWSGWRLAERADTLYSIVAAESGGVDTVKEFIASRLPKYATWLQTLPRAPICLMIESVLAGQLSVSWVPSSSLVVPITGYAIQYANGTGALRRFALGPEAREFTLTGLVAGTNDTVRVRSIFSLAASNKTCVTSLPVR